MRPHAEQRFAAMGTTAHVVVVGPDAEEHVGHAMERVFDLEQRWSRFVPTSEISQLNAAAGESVEVSPLTLCLVDHAVAAWRLTGGSFDPTMVLQLQDAGYDRSFERIEMTSPGHDQPVAGSGCGDVHVDRCRREVTIPADIGLDPGGIGKGLAADIITRELTDAGAWGVMVNLGGDLAVRGLPKEGEEWLVNIVEPTVHPGAITTTRLRDSGLATSTTAKRRWRCSDRERHHILDPATGDSTHTSAVLATVIAGEAWWAEVTATALLVRDEPGRCTESSLVIHADGHTARTGDFERFEL